MIPPSTPAGRVREYQQRKSPRVIKRSRENPPTKGEAKEDVREGFIAGRRFGIEAVNIMKRKALTKRPIRVKTAPFKALLHRSPQKTPVITQISNGIVYPYPKIGVL